MQNNVVKFKGNLRTCKSCKAEKPLSEFHFHKGNNAHMHKCEDCFIMSERKRQNDLWANNPEYRAAHNAKGQKHRKETGWKDTRTIKDRAHYRYGISWEQLKTVLQTQFGLCANRAYGKEISLDAPGMAANRAVIDHDHDTGLFRSLLCHDCNKRLGAIEASQNLTLGLLEYLNKYAPTKLMAIVGFAKSLPDKTNHN